LLDLHRDRRLPVRALRRRRQRRSVMPLPPWMTRRYKLFFIIAAVGVLLDQLAKLWARHALVAVENGHTVLKPLVAIKGHLEFHLSYNMGSAFGMFRNFGGTRIWLSLIALGACVAIFFLVRKAKDDQTWTTWALGLVFSGALGNALDRIFLGKVTDYAVIWYPWYKSKLGWFWRDWPAFNVADAALVAGVIILFLDIGREQKKAAAEKKAADKAADKAKEKRVKK
jgi:signal peptidase II